MTTLRKPVRRLTAAAYAVLHHRRLRQIVVSLEPGDVLVFREKGRRTRYSLPVDGAFRYAVRCSVEAGRRMRKGGSK
jgi:hypothetical protein